MMRGQCNSIFRKILIELEIASPKVKQIFYKAALVDAFNKDEENIATMDAHIKIIVKWVQMSYLKKKYVSDSWTN